MITLTSDFGLKDPYVAEMKGVILTISPKATIVDITHDVEKFNVRTAALVLASAAPYFPENTIHLAVVDPGVGTKRRAIVIQTQRGFFVGPDNGILILAAESQGIEHIYELTNPKFMNSKISNTFHGRDIFAPAAAYLEKGQQPAEFGLEIKDPVKPKFANMIRKGDSLMGEILHVDSFGNIITNINEKEVQSRSKIVKVILSEVSLELKLTKTYAEAKPQDPIVLVGGHGFLEVALNGGNAAQKFHAKAGDKITVMTT
jgi:S-adenosyl-L-methionine hydrolase (adenosine-forming)